MNFGRALQHIREGRLHDLDVRMGVLLPDTNQKHPVFYGVHRSSLGISGDGWYRSIEIGAEAGTVEILEKLPVTPFWLFHEWFVEYPDGNTLFADEEPLLGVGVSKTVWDHLLEK